MAEPPLGTRVELRRIDEPTGKTYATKVDAAGHFSFQRLEEGLWRVDVVSPDGRWATRVVPVFTSTVLAPFERLEVDEAQAVTDEEPEVTLSGIAMAAGVEERTSPLPGAWVWIEGRPDQLVRSAADGSFELRVPWAHRVTLRAAAPGFVPLRESRRIPEGVERHPGLGVLFHPSVLLEGCVVDSDGRAVPGAELGIERTRRFYESRTRPSPRDEPVFQTRDGCFFHMVEAGGEVLLRTELEGYEAARQNVDLPMERDARVRVDVQLTPVASAWGTVVDEAGHPIEGGQLVFLREASADALMQALVGREALARRNPTAVTGADGVFQLAELPPGTYSVAVRARGFEPSGVSDVAIGGQPSPWPVGTFFLSPAAKLEGRLEDRRSPVASSSR